jgi:hypothetical protein
LISPQIPTIFRGFPTNFLCLRLLCIFAVFCCFYNSGRFILDPE